MSTENSPRPGLLQRHLATSEVAISLPSWLNAKASHRSRVPVNSCKQRLSLDLDRGAVRGGVAGEDRGSA